MEIKDLRISQGNVEIVADVIEKSDARQFDKFGQIGKVATAIIKDASGTVKLSLWNEQIDSVNVGDTIKVINGYVKEFKGEKQITTGKMGKIEIIKKKDEVFTNLPPESDKVEKDEGFLDDDDIVL